MSSVLGVTIDNSPASKARPEFETANVAFESQWVDDRDKPKNKDGTYQQKKQVIVLISYPGNRDSTPMRWDHMSHRQKMELQSRYDQWEKGDDITVKGTPLVSWSVLPRATYELFIRAGFQTLEQVAAIADHNNTELPTELKKWPKKAKLFLDAAGSDQARVAALTEEVEALRALNRQYEDKIEMMVKNAAVGSPIN
jgi:hypothetical protein